MDDDSAPQDSLAELDAAWEKEKRPFLTQPRFGALHDPTAGDVALLIMGGIFFFVLGIGYLVFSLNYRGDSTRVDSLYVIGFFLVSAAYFWLASEVKSRLKGFRIAKAEYLKKRAELEARLRC